MLCEEQRSLGDMAGASLQAMRSVHLCSGKGQAACGLSDRISSQPPPKKKLLSATQPDYHKRKYRYRSRCPLTTANLRMKRNDNCNRSNQQPPAANR